MKRVVNNGYIKMTNNESILLITWLDTLSTGFLHMFWVILNHIEYTYKIQIKKHILPFLVQVDDTYCVLHKATFNINL